MKNLLTALMLCATFSTFAALHAQAQTSAPDSSQTARVVRPETTRKGMTGRDFGHARSTRSRLLYSDQKWESEAAIRAAEQEAARAKEKIQRAREQLNLQKSAYLLSAGEANKREAAIQNAEGLLRELEKTIQLCKLKLEERPE